jgi:FkbM family methyltransferase
MKTIVQKPSVFDQSHYLQLIEARGQFIRRMVSSLAPALGLSTALDAGCGLGFFAQILQQCGLSVRGFDGRVENVEEASKRFPQITFAPGDIQDPAILHLGKFDLVLCFGLLYHLENPLLAIRHLRALTHRGLLLESMCLPDERPWMLLREERRLEDQSLTDVAFYPSEGCLVKMLYRAGFAAVYRITPLPDHDDFRDTPEHSRRRTVLFASPQPLTLPEFTLLAEPRETADPWTRIPTGIASLPRRLRRFLAQPAREKYFRMAVRLRRWLPRAPIPLRLSFGAWWITEHSALDYLLLSGNFENAEICFVEKFLRPGMTVLDIGAHHGLYTLLASKRVGPRGRVVAIEPSPRERKRLHRHIRLNFCSNVRIEPVALGKTAAQANLFLVKGLEDYCNSLRPPATAAETRTVRVKVISLDELLPRAAGQNVDFIKLDVEGAELDVLQGASRLLQAEPRPVLLVEVYDIRTEPWGYRAREIVQFLDRAGYHWFRLRENGVPEAVASDCDAYDTNLVAIPNERVSQVMQNLGER